MKKKFERSSGNVFADLNLSNPEETLAKAELARQIHSIIKKKKLTQKQAALVLGIDQPKVSVLASGKLSGFSLERLFRFLNELGQDVTINVKPKSRAHKKGSISINTSDTVSIPKETHKRLKTIAVILGKSMREIVIESIEDHLYKTDFPNKETLKAIKRVEKGKDLIEAENAEVFFKKLGI